MSLEIDPPISPCQGICRLEAETCTGCGRLMGEIIEWPSASGGRKSLICVEAAKRLAIIQLRSAMQDTLK
ncbi:MAG: DUF1289 domain-containing protein [Stagnimonas sp.]|nr:DUF1289 domain-containing protein [Stagnimonas sp.]